MMKQINFNTNAQHQEWSTKPANSIEIGTRTAKIIKMKVENVYLLVRLLWLISLVDLMFSMISLVLRPSTIAPRKISKIS